MMTATPDIVGMRTVGIPVTDQDRALAFYTGTLGLRLRVDAPVPQLRGRWIEVAPPAVATTLALVPARAGLPAGVPTGVRLTTSDATAAHDALAACGVEVGEVLRWAGVPPMFEVRDPDGNGFEIVEDPA
jgi:lactoylglutathione lyase